jgi:hypothetical protein
VPRPGRSLVDSGVDQDAGFLEMSSPLWTWWARSTSSRTGWCALPDRLTELLPDADHVACPATAFHRGLPGVVLPGRRRARWDLHRHGFRGLSSGWAVRRAAELPDRPAGGLNLLVAHLSGGCPVCPGRPATPGSSSATPAAATPPKASPGASAVPGISGGLHRGRERDAVIGAPGTRVPVLAIRSREELDPAGAALTAEVRSREDRRRRR